MNGKIVKEWINKAEQDYMASKALARQRSISVFDVICFHCHQCVEKYLKAFLTLNDVRFPKSHDLIVLQNLASQTDGTFELIKDLVKPLNGYAVQFRYPGDEAHKKEAQHAIKRMEETRKFIRDKIY
jgi:HEPN domain-containing protein